MFWYEKKFTELNMRYDFYMALQNGHPPLSNRPAYLFGNAAGDLTTTLSDANSNLSLCLVVLLLCFDYGAA